MKPTTTATCPRCNKTMTWHYSFPVTMELDSPYRHVFRCEAHPIFGTISTEPDALALDGLIEFDPHQNSLIENGNEDDDDDDDLGRYDGILQ